VSRAASGLHRLCVSLIVACALVAAVCPSPAGEAARPPNILLINADNLGYGDLGLYGSKLHRTPRIDRLAAEGIRFTDFYAASPVCTSSRAALLTGSYPQRTGMHEFEWDGSVLRPVSPHGLHPDEITLAELLRARGYFTACVGKWHLGDQREFLPAAHGFDYFLGLLYSDEMDDSIKGYRWPPMPLMLGDRVVEAPAILETMTRRYTEQVQRLIREHRERPFFIYLPHMSPGSRTEPIAGTEFQGKSRNGKYGDTVEELDWSTGEILNTLAELGLEKKTLVIWTADNGAPPPRGTKHHGSFGPLAPRVRYDASEGGMRVPFIARWPGRIKPGTICRELATNMDLFTTLALIGGATVPRDRVIDGKDIRPLLLGEPHAKSPHEAFYYYMGSQLQAVRAGPWKLHLPLPSPLIQLGMGEQGRSVTGRSNRMFSEPTPARLHNFDEDIGETRDVAAEHPEVVARLLALAEKARADIGDLDRPGKGVRPAGRVTNPRPQVLGKPR
jgi:arylsulfatase A